MQTLCNTVFPSKEEAVAQILSDADGHPFLVATHHASGRYEVDHYE
jgi:hypothetical protein